MNLLTIELIANALKLNANGAKNAYDLARTTIDYVGEREGERYEYQKAKIQREKEDVIARKTSWLNLFPQVPQHLVAAEAENERRVDIVRRSLRDGPDSVRELATVFLTEPEKLHEAVELKKDVYRRTLELFI